MSSLDIQTLKIFLQQVKKTRIAIVGDSMLDIFSYGTIERMSPEAPVPVIELVSRDYLLGGAANVSKNISDLGGNVVLYSVVGKDDTSRMLTKMLTKEKIKTVFVHSTTRKTTTKERVIENSKHFVRIDVETKNEIERSEETRLIENFKKNSSAIDVLIFSDYAKGVITKRLVDQFCKIAHSQKIPIIVDTKPKNAHLYKGKKISLFTPNSSEAEGISGKKNLNTAAIYLQDYFSSSILITKGHEGMTLYEGKEKYHVDATSTDVVDVSGCGDTVIATLSLAIAVGEPMKHAIVLANHAAGIVVRKKGTATVSPKEFLR